MRSLLNYCLKYNWLFKWVGAILGYLLDGPLGALIGLIFFKALQYLFLTLYQPMSQALDHQKIKAEWKYFFQSTFSILGYMAKVDGRISEEEINLAKKIMRELVLNRKDVEFAKSLFRAGKHPYFNLGQNLSIFQRHCEHNSYLVQLFLNLQYRMARVDGFPTRKQVVMDRILKQLGFKPSSEQARKAEEHASYGAYEEKSHDAPISSHSRIESAYALLKLNNMQATREEVKRAYRKLISTVHPDKLIAQGFSDAQIRAATLKTQEIRKAYEDICAYKGW